MRGKRDSSIGLRSAGLVAVFTLTLCGLASPASAEWRRAESERFIVYSDGDERVLRDYVQKLETFDRILRHETGLPIEEVPPRKLPIYLVARHAGLEQVRPGLSERVAGFYSASQNDIFAIGIRTRGEDHVLLHEYVHHFMMQNFNTGYPAWFVEGFAEYYMTAEIEARQVALGKPTDGRTGWLHEGAWIPLEDLLTKRPGQITRRVETYYPLSWLVTHWFLSDPARKARLNTYMVDTKRGADPVEAMETAAGMPLAALERTLSSYLKGNLLYTGFRFDFPRSEITVTVLDPSADDLLLLSQRLKTDIGESEKDATLAEVRRLAAAHGDDRLARLTLARAEIDLGDRAAGRAILTEMLQADPDVVEALQLLALSALASHEDENADIQAANREAMGHLRRAYGLDPDNYLTLYLLGRTRQGFSGYPSDNDMEIWGEALYLAPQLDGVRLNTAQALLMRGRQDEAVAVLTPLANAPHSGGSAAARLILARITGPEDDAEGPASDAENDPSFDDIADPDV